MDIIGKNFIAFNGEKFKVIKDLNQNIQVEDLITLQLYPINKQLLLNMLKRGNVKEIILDKTTQM